VSSARQQHGLLLVALPATFRERRRMKPTLYADDLGFDDVSWVRKFARVLPRRCPGLDAMPSDHVRCECDGLGFLYPDPPDWWYQDILQSISMPNEGQLQVNIRQEWEIFLHDAWRVLGVIEDD